MAGIRESKPKLINTLDNLITHLQAETEFDPVEWQAVMIAREVVSSSSIDQLAKAIGRVADKVQGTKAK